MPEFIPQIIHYCWFGKAQKSPLIESCIASWKQYLPHYKIIEWNEDNSSLDCDFAIKAFEKKKWAFLSDYIRLKVLYQYGGIYLDTDMLLIKEFNDLEKYNCFFGKQDNGEIAAGIIGCHAKNGFIGTSLKTYENIDFDENRLMNMAIPKILTEVYSKYDEKDEVKIFPFDTFYPYTFEESLEGINYLDKVTKATLAIHLWNASWFTEKELAGFALERGNYIKFLILMIKYTLKNPRFLLSIPVVLSRVIKRK